MIDSVRASRDGDQFHYVWAARQCLKLLRAGSGLMAVSVEGSSPLEAAAGEGEQVIDLAEYYGGIDPALADHVIYRQLKHSTVHPEAEWTASGLKRTVEGFAQKFLALYEADPQLATRVSFEFVSNRPVSATVAQAFAHIASGEAPRDRRLVDLLRGYLGLPEDLAGPFCRQFVIDNRAPALLRLVDVFGRDVSAVLPGAPNDSALRLKEAVATRATSLQQDRLITREVVLAALGASSDLLLPAPSLLQKPDNIVAIPQAASLAETLSSSTEPVIVHAAGGIGKSVLASQLGAMLPNGSLCLVYDCFALGSYRRSSAPRHEHRQGYVQLCNELAAAGLSEPLVPVGTATSSDYSRAFIARVRTAARALAAASSGALLVLAIDAADNAVIAANQQGTGRCFVVDLLREELPPNVRVVEFCRTERVGLLDPPPGTRRFELFGFDLEHSAQHLRSRFGEVATGDAREFHRRTGGNPRVQAQVMRQSDSPEECLSRLSHVAGNNVATIDDLLANLLDEVRYHNSPQDAAAIDLVCEALACMRPRIPIAVLVQLCGVSASLIRSLAADLGGSLLVEGDALQFRDEPTETWFRSRFSPQGAALTDLLARLRPLATHSGYVAASLPYLMWEVGEFDELVKLAMTDDALPVDNELERHQISQLRVQFALKAALRQAALLPAARLGVRAGVLSSGHSRRLALLRDNADLAGEFLDEQTTEDLVARRELTGEWPNSNLVHEGALLSFTASQQDAARSRLRSAIEWTVAWVNAPRDDHERHHVEPEDIADIGLGLLNVDGAEACVSFLQRWRPEPAAWKPAALIAGRLIQHGRVSEIEDLLQQAEASAYVLLGVAFAAAQAGLQVRSAALAPVLGLLRGRTEPVDAPPPYSIRGDDPDLTLAICWTVALGVRHELLAPAEAAVTLAPYLPDALPASAGSRWQTTGVNRSLIKGLALLSRLRGEPFDVTAVAPAEVAEAKKRPYTHSGTVAEFAANVEPYAKWADLWSQAMLGLNIDSDLQRVATESLRAVTDYDTPYMFVNAVTRTGALLLAGNSSSAIREQFAAWIRSNHQYLSRAALTEAVQHASASPQLHDIALELAQLTASEIAASQDGAETQIDELVKLARAIYRLSPDESQTYFEQAVATAEKLGDDVHARWTALLTISNAASSDQPDRARAYRLAQITEALIPFLHDSLNYEEALHSITQLDDTEGIAVASRWRDRRIGWLDPTVRALAIRDDAVTSSMPLISIALAMFQREPMVMTAAQRALTRSPHQAQLIIDTVATLPRFMVDTRRSLAILKEAAAQAGVLLDWSALDRYEAPHHRRSDGPIHTSRDWGAEPEDRAVLRSAAEKDLRELDLTSADGLAAAHALCESTPIDRRDILAEAAAYPPATLTRVVRAVVADTNFSLFDYNDLIKRLARRPSLPRSTVAALRDMAAILARRFCFELTTKSYEPLDIAALVALAELPTDPIGVALEEVGRRPEMLTGEACFALAARLAKHLSPTDARIVFDDASDQYADVAPADSADGSMSQVAPAPSSIAACVAGFVWAALGDPAIATRWQAAHAVCALVRLRQTAVLDALARYATGAVSVLPFVDQRLVFYDKHALVWLLMALERSNEGDDGVIPFVPLLRALADGDQDHVLVREAVRGILLSLHASGVAMLDSGTRSALESANRPIGFHTREMKRGTNESQSSVEPAVHFFFDFEGYWCRSLGDVFDVDDKGVVVLASDVVTKTWALPYRGDAIEDERRSRRLYGENATWSHRSEWPKEDDLDFYLGFHALMTVAGQLVRTRPVYSSEWDDGQDQFDEWLRRFRPSRGDHRWLADRRDRSPRATIALHDDTRIDANWEFGLSADTFERCLSTEPNWLTVWETSSDQTYDRSQDIVIESALVDPAHARALAAALQTAGSYSDFRLPSVDDEDFTFNEFGYRLGGWISDRSREGGLDCEDPFAAHVRYPPPHPSDDVTHLFSLDADADMREWRRSGTVALRSIVWDDLEDSGHSARGPQGSRLEIQSDALQELLRGSGSWLVMTVMINRSVEGMRQRQSEDERFPYREKSYRVFLFDESCRRVDFRLGRRAG
ncbi:MAG: hypothetical protein ACTHMS_05775 [Jatrophihabitans sp.]|uniref:hypothetical protein n=1 Tax=Jatrophihabitans sp. TaxID=1932789 RepID=UPI003F806FC1